MAAASLAEKAVEKVAELVSARKSEQPHLLRSVLILFNNKQVWQLFAKCVAIAGVNGSKRLASNSPSIDHDLKWMIVGPVFRKRLRITFQNSPSIFLLFNKALDRCQYRGTSRIPGN